MMMRFILAAAIAVCFATVADAQARKLQADEIEEILSGNTASGRWDGVPYQQYFDPDGTTVFAADGAAPQTGEWRIDGEEYQSIWAGDTEWESWFVMEYLGDYYWVSRSTPPTPFEVLDGQHVAQ